MCKSVFFIDFQSLKTEGKSWEVLEKSLNFKHTCLYEPYLSSLCHLGDNCILNFHLGRYIVGYTFGNLVLGWLMSRAVKHDFWTYILTIYLPKWTFWIWLGFAQAWKVLENESFLEKSLNTKFCLEKYLKIAHTPWKVLELSHFPLFWSSLQRKKNLSKRIFKFRGLHVVPSADFWSSKTHAGLEISENRHLPCITKFIGIHGEI